MFGMTPPEWGAMPPECQLFLETAADSYRDRLGHTLTGIQLEQGGPS